MGCLDIKPQSCKPDVNRSQGTPACPALCAENNNEVGVPLYDSPAINCSLGPHNIASGGNNDCDDTIVEQPVNEFTLNHRYAQRAEDIIADAASCGDPFFLYIGFAHTHTPMAYETKKWGNASKRPGYVIRISLVVVAAHIECYAFYHVHQEWELTLFRPFFTPFYFQLETTLWKHSCRGG